LADRAATDPPPTLGIVSGLYELFPDNDLVARSLGGLSEAIPPGGYLVYTNQPWHPQLHDPRTGRFAIRSCFGTTNGSQRARLFHLDQRVASEAVRLRQALRLRDLPTDPGSNWFTTAATSAIATPLWRDGRIIGTLAAYDRVSGDGFSIVNFDEDDLLVLARLGGALEQAVAYRAAREHADRGPLIDGDTALPNAAAIADTIHAEIVRASRRGEPLALAVCSIENFDALDGLGEGARIPRLLARIADAMRAHVREFDVIARTGPSEFTVVLPEPGPDPGDRISAFARAVAHDVAKDDPLNDPLRVELGFGYAIYPEDGRDRAALVQQARTIRIRML
jgi:diguanylate cyclase (GGDEF)-like protein